MSIPTNKCLNHYSDGSLIFPNRGCSCPAPESPNPSGPQLLPCPFCGKQVSSLETAQELGGDGNSDEEWAVVCGIFEKGCGASSGYAKSTEGAILKWNQRAKSPETLRLEATVSEMRAALAPWAWMF